MRDASDDKTWETILNARAEARRRNAAESAILVRCLVRLSLVIVVVVSVILSLAAGLLFLHTSAPPSLFLLGNLVGPTTESLLHGGGLSVCTIGMGTPGNPICFHAGRMPVPTLVTALGVRLFGDRVLAVALLKTLLFLIPIELSIVLVWRRMPASRMRQMMVAFLLLAPFGMTAFLADVNNMQVEEGYSYSVLALAVALLLFGSRGWGWLVTFAVCVDVLYLSKSSMAPAAAVLTLYYLYRERGTAARVTLLVLVAAAPVGWALHQHHASGRYSVGTSLDGINLHKANVASFLEHYPPRDGATLDQYDEDLNRGLIFPDEWSFDDYHRRAGMLYLETHPWETLVGDGRKLEVLFVSVSKVGSSQSHGALLVLETAGLVVFRIVLWAAMAGSVYGIVRRMSWNGAGWVFLLVTGACVLPYLLGFAYTRHASILIYPACLMCCRMLMDSADEPNEGLE